MMAGFFFAACSSPQQAAAPKPVPAPSPAPAPLALAEKESRVPPPAPPAAPSAENRMIVSMTVTDLQGKPLAGMNPMVTTRPNAFDKPVAVGSLTDANGKGTVQFPSSQTLFIRAWDPNLNWFPNNFFEVPASTGVASSEAAITMVAAAAVEAQFTLPDGSPVASQSVAMMMIQAEWGPWWPAQSVTDPNGRAQFSNVPPGVYSLQFKLDAGPAGAREKVEIRPGAQVDLAIIPLQ